MKMLTLDKVFNAQTVLKNIIRETNVVRAYGIAPDCELYLKPEMEMSINAQSKNPLNLKYTQYRICFSEWSVAKRGKTDSRAAVEKQALI